MKKRVLHFVFWTVSLLITLAVATVQRRTGPSYPLKDKEVIEGETVGYRFLRSAVSGNKMMVSLRAGELTGAMLRYRRVNSDDLWTEIPMEKEDGSLVAFIPPQPPAGKVEYKVIVQKGGRQIPLNRGKAVVVRFRGAVPSIFLLLHVLLMFSGLFFVSRCFFCRWDSDSFRRIMVHWTTVQLFLGGMIFGPIVQKYAFGYFWTGFPLGTDLTDNKMLLILLIWLTAIFFCYKRKNFLFLAALLTFLIYLIPHSLLGSELDYQSGRQKNVYGSLNSPGVPDRSLFRLS